jgi:hypothetical protein
MSSLRISALVMVTLALPLGWVGCSVSSQSGKQLASSTAQSANALVASFTPVPNEPPSGTGAWAVGTNLVVDAIELNDESP